MWDAASTLQRGLHIGDCGSGTVGSTGQQEGHWQVAVQCSQSSKVSRELTGLLSDGSRQISSALTIPENVVS